MREWVDVAIIYLLKPKTCKQPQNKCEIMNWHFSPMIETTTTKIKVSNLKNKKWCLFCNKQVWEIPSNPQKVISRRWSRGKSLVQQCLHSWTYFMRITSGRRIRRHFLTKVFYCRWTWFSLDKTELTLVQAMNQYIVDLRHLLGL